MSAAVFPPVVLPERIARPERISRDRADVLASAGAVAAMAALASIRGLWVTQVAALLLLLTVPGVLALRAARVHAQAVRAFPIYVLGASVLVLTGAGLAVDLLGPLIGVSRPLETTPLIVSLTAACAGLIAAAVPGRAPRLRDYLDVRVRIGQGWPLLLPALAWAGAGRLTDGHSSFVAAIAVIGAGAALAYGCLRAHRASIAQSATLIFGVALALILGFSLRGHFLYGFDIASEYHTFTAVLDAGRWHTYHHNDAYGAMLSLTVLPTTLARLTGASAVLVFKAIYPCMFALFPVAVFLLATRVLTRRFAFLAALFLVVQDYLFQQLPAVARQEIGLLFFVCLLGAILDGRLARRQRSVLVAMFAVGTVVSHYSTAYLAIGVLAIALVLEFVRGRVRSGGARVPLAPLAIALAVAVGSVAVWYGAVTDSTQNLSQFVSEVHDQGLAILPNSAGHGVVSSYLAGNVTTPISPAQYEALAHADYAHNKPFVHPLPGTAGYVLHGVKAPSATVASPALYNALDDEQSAIGLLAEALAALGALALWVRRREGYRATEIALLGVASVLALGVIRLSGTVAVDYGQGRAFLQAMVPLSICLAWALQRFWGWKRFSRPARAGVVAFVLGLFVLLFTTSGLSGVVVGGGTTTNLANAGSDYDHFYLTAPELAAAGWVNAAAPKGDLVYTDNYGELRITAASGRSIGVLTQLTPATLDRNAWIYADTANFVDHRVEGAEGDDDASYSWPAFITRHWNLVYSNGLSGVYARSH